jgi:acyl carrier protein
MVLPPCSALRRALIRHFGGETQEFARAALLEDDLGLDPLDLTLIALGLEEEHGEEFPLPRLRALRTVSELDDLVERWLAGQRLSAA